MKMHYVAIWFNGDKDVVEILVRGSQAACKDAAEQMLNEKRHENIDWVSKWQTSPLPNADRDAFVARHCYNSDVEANERMVWEIYRVE